MERIDNISAVSLNNDTLTNHEPGGPADPNASHHTSADTTTEPSNKQDFQGKPEILNRAENEVLIVDWDGPDDPDNPKNWPEKRKWAAALAVSSFTFISPVASSMIAPAAFQIAAELNIKSNVEVALTISVFVLAYAVGPLFLGPLSEIFGRSRVLQLANLFFLAFVIACSFATTKSQLIAFRFLSGLGGSAPLSVGGAVLGDMWNPENRGRAVGIYSVAPLLGPSIGPLAGAWVAQKSTWRWVFRAVAIADAIVQAFGLYFLQETFAPVLLKRKADAIQKKLLENVSDPEKSMRQYKVVQTIYERRQAKRSLKSFVFHALIRPFVLFVEEPIIQLFGIYLAFVYGTAYLVITTIPRIYTEVYHQEIGIVGLHYISLSIGLLGAAQLNARLMDKTYRRLKAKHGVGKPEFRLVTVIPMLFCLPIGLLLGGWSAQKHLPWIVTDIAFVFMGIGTASAFLGLQAYVIDSFTLYAASALAAVSCFRSLAGFGFPLFAPYMYDSLGYGKGDTILAAFSLCVGCPGMILFWKYGERIRGMSRRAQKSAAARTATAIVKQPGPI